MVWKYKDKCYRIFLDISSTSDGDFHPSLHGGGPCSIHESTGVDWVKANLDISPEKDIQTMRDHCQDPSKTAGEFGEEMGDTILAFPAGFFSSLASTGANIGADILAPGGAQPFTSVEAVEATGKTQVTVCDRYGFDLVEIKRKLDGASGLEKIQGTFAWTFKLLDMKQAGCAKPGFVSQTTWDRVPT